MDNKTLEYLKRLAGVAAELSTTAARAAQAKRGASELKAADDAVSKLLSLLLERWRPGGAQALRRIEWSNVAFPESTFARIRVPPPSLAATGETTDPVDLLAILNALQQERQEADPAEPGTEKDGKKSD